MALAEESKKGRKGKKAEKAKKAENGGDEKRGLFGIRWLGGRKPSAPDDPPASSGGSGGDDKPSTGFRGFFERASVLLVLGLFALLGIGAGVYLMFFQPEPVTFAPRVHVIPLPTPTFESYAPADATDFFAVLPSTDLEYGLRNAQATFMQPVTTWPTRFAEEWYLTYDDGAGGTMTVQAVQHYSLEAADTAYQELLATATAEIVAALPVEPTPSPAATPSPTSSPSPSPTIVPGLDTGIVHVDKAEVGKSFKVVKEITEVIEDPDGGDPTEVTTTVGVVTWQNETGVFIMTADPSVIDVLFLEYGI